jgi:hypothetical protein
METVWVFNGTGGTFPSGVFLSRELANAWIARHQLSGTLSGYPLNTPVYEWVIARGHWRPEYPSQKTPEFCQRFSSAYLEHYHYENGQAR